MKILVTLSLLAVQVAAIWPVPKALSTGSSYVWISPNVKVEYNGKTVSLGQDGMTLSSTFTSQAIVTAAVQRAFTTIFAEKFVPWKLYPRNEISQFEPAAGSKKVLISTLTITQTGKDNSTTFKPLAGTVDESYTLTVGKDGSAIISAVSSTGILHALQTFTQLFFEHSTGAGVYSPFAPVTISDAPEFSHRGLNFDVARNWFPMADILRTIDAISWNKLNRLHLHMTDAQSWPIDIPALPALSQKGAYATGLSYTPEMIAEIQQYAIYRGVNVVIEFDMPGHTSSIALAYPDLITAFEATPWDNYCAEPPCGSLKLDSPAVATFLDTLLGDILPRVSPYSAYFHTGGDEVNVNAYLLDDTVKSNLTTVLQPLMQKFVDRNHDQLRAAGLTPMVWEEMLLVWNVTLGSDVVVQSWLSEESVASITAAGHKVLFGDYNYWYLDCGQGEWLDFSNGESFDTYFPFNDWCPPFKNWKYIYAYDPTATLSAAQKELVLGGEIHIWSEQTDPVNLDDMVWPRAGAAAEVMWSGRQDSTGQNRSQLDASPRLAEMRERMVLRGVRAGPVQMVFCTQHNSTECSL